MIEKWKVISKKIYKHSPYRSIEDVTFQLPNGEEKVFALKKEGIVNGVLAIDKNNHVILTKQYRPGPDMILDELPGGVQIENESNLEAAKRELKEETGYESKHWVYLGAPIDCAYSTIVRHGFLATNCYKTSEQELDETEFIEIVFKPLDEFFEQLKQGLCTDTEIAWMGLYQLGYLKK